MPIVRMDAVDASGSIAPLGEQRIEYTVASAHLQSRSAPYSFNITYTSPSLCSCDDQLADATIEGLVYVNAPLDLHRTTVAIDHSSALVAGSALLVVGTSGSSFSDTIAELAMLPAPLQLAFRTPFIKAHQGPKLPLDGAFERCAALVIVLPCAVWAVIVCEEPNF